MSVFNKNKFTPAREITSDKLNYWKRKYGEGLFEFSLGGHVAYFRKLTVKEIETELKKFAQRPVSEFGKEADATSLSFKLIDNAMIGGDKCLVNEEQYKQTTLEIVGDFVLKNINEAFPHLGIKN